MNTSPQHKGNSNKKMYLVVLKIFYDLKLEQIQTLILKFEITNNIVIVIVKLLIAFNVNF